MKLIRLSPDRIFYRFHGPRWASQPISGSGAAMFGGRFNRPGIAALYLAGDPVTALAEYVQGAPITLPGTLVAYQTEIDGVIELDEAELPAASCDWKFLARIAQQTPPSWLIADRLIADRRRGLLYPSIRHLGGQNLVLFLDNFTRSDRVLPHDPNASLPRDQSSWPPSP